MELPVASPCINRSDKPMDAAIATFDAARARFLAAAKADLG